MAENPIYQKSFDNPNYTIIIQQIRQDNKVVEVVASMPEDIKIGVRSDWEAPLSNGILGMMPGAINGLLRMYGVKPATQAMTLQVWQGNTQEQDYTLDLILTTFSDPEKDIRTPLLNLMSLVSPDVDDSGVIKSPGPSMDPEAAGKVIAGGAAMSYKILSEAAAKGGTALAGLAGAVSGGAYSKDQAQKTVDATKSSLSQMADEVTTANMPTLKDIKNGMIHNAISISIGRFMFFDSVVILDVSPDCDLAVLDGATGYPNIVRVAVTFRPLFMLSAADWQEVLLPISDSAGAKTGAAAPEASRAQNPTRQSVVYDPVSDTTYRSSNPPDGATIIGSSEVPPTTADYAANYN